ncbi:AAA family ATPase [Merismopedia glauca]|nr:AAA family ATPase [Merismopedia glauca]
MSSLPALIEQMQQPDFYPHPVVEPIQLMQTHISYVLLTGEFVYKIKKPVNFGFLNYSTLELRSQFCQEEIRLNQRGAAELYLEVVSITQKGDKYQLNGTVEVVEYAVKMRQFSQETLFSHLLEEAKITPELITELGLTIAQFHAKAATNEYISSFGKVAQVKAVVDDNYQYTEKYIGIAQSQSQYTETKAFTDNFFATNQELFASRIANGYIRECHGDLHLRNICLGSNNRILLFDCIEFNEEFRFADVMYDVAFVVMDLDAKKRRDLGNIFLNTYIEQTGDWSGIELLPLYLCRQAYVRAKVASFLLSDRTISDAEKQDATQTAANYYKLAWEYTQPQTGKLILMSGVSGSGKSTVAKQLAPQINAIHVRSDAVRKHLAVIPLTDKGGKDLYTPEMTDRTYGKLLDIGIRLANQGFKVILDAKYDRQALRSEVITQAQPHHIPIQIIHCTAPEEIIRERLKLRHGDISDATVDLLSSQLANAEPFTETEMVYVTDVDTIITQSLADESLS